MNNLWINLITKNVYKCPSSHIAYLIENADRFSFDGEEITRIHRYHNERLGQEGKARDWLIKDSIERGWIRITYVARSRTYVITCLSRQINQARIILDNYLFNNGINNVEIKEICL